MDLEVIRRILVEAKTTGVEQTTAQLKGLSVGYEGVAVASQKTESATEIATRKFQRLEGYLDPAARAARQLAKDISTLDAQLAQTGNIERHNELLNLATQNAIRMSGGAKAATGVMEGFKQTISGVSGQLVGMAAGMGPVGIFLSALGPWGIAAAVGLNLLSGALTAVRESAAAAGQKARDLVELSEATKLSVNELRGLKTTAARFGVGEEQLETWLTKATISMEKARTGTGELADVLTTIDPAFVEALQNAKTFAERLDVLTRAGEAAKAQGKEVALYWRDVFGRGSGRADLVMTATQLAGGVAAVGAAMEQYGGATTKEIENRAHLSEVNKRLQKEYDALYASSLKSSAVLEAEKIALEAKIAALRVLVGEQAKQVRANDAVIESQNALNEKYADEKRILDEVQEAQEATAAGRATLLRRIGVLGASRTGDAGIANRDVALQEGPTPAAAITPIAPAADAAAAATEKLTVKLTALEEAQKQLGQDTRWIGALGTAATSAETARLAVDKLKVAHEENAFGLKDTAEAEALYERALASVAVQANALTAVHQAAIQTLHARTAAERQAAAAATVKASDAGGDAAVHAQQAVTMEIEKQKQAHRDAMNAMNGQLAVAQAVTGAEQMAAQQAATYAALIEQGRTKQQAMAEATKQTAIAQAQITAAAKNQLFALQNAAAGAAAVTGQQKIEAQYEQTINQLKRQGVDATLAASIAEQERANAIKQANAAVEQTIHGIENEIELINTRSESEKNSVLIRQAYNDAIRSGADAQAASALASAVAQKQNAEAMAKQDATAKQIQITEANRATEIGKCNRAIQDQNDGLAESVRLAIEYNKWVERIYAGETLLSQMDFNVPKPGSGGSTTSRTDTGIPWGPGRVSYFGPTMPPEFFGDPQAAARQQKDKDDRLQKQKDALQKQVDQFETSRIKAQIAGDKGAEISAVQGELGFYQKQPESLANLQQIKSLTDTLKQLTDATKDNTASQNALSGLYSRQFGQGFYDGGAAVGELIYGLDNNTSGAIDAMQTAANDNTRNQNDLLKDLSQKQVSTFTYTGTASVAATNGVQNELRTGFSFVVSTLDKNAAAARTQQGPTIPAPTNPNRLPGFAAGGSFTTQGSGADDSNVVAFRVSPQRERVTIAPATGAAPGAGGTINHYYNNDITITIPQNTDEFRSSAMQVADEIFNQVAIAGRRK